jgi:hypothetical protein
MRDFGAFLQWLLQNPIILIFLFGAVASVFGRVLKALKTDAERRMREARSGRMPGHDHEPPQPARDAEEIAREIRRMMQQGLEERAEPARRAERGELVERAERAERAEPVELAEDFDRRPKPAHERQRTRRAEVRAFEQQAAEAVAHTAAARAPKLPVLTPLPAPGEGTAHAAAARPRAKWFAVTDLREAILMSEVLGTPVSMRE